jgi:hypothetical protein
VVSLRFLTGETRFILADSMPLVVTVARNVPPDGITEKGQQYGGTDITRSLPKTKQNYIDYRLTYTGHNVHMLLRGIKVMLSVRTSQRPVGEWRYSTTHS